MTPAFRDADGGYGISAIAALCGGGAQGATCPTPETNNPNHLYVATTDDTGASNEQAFYITVS